jgi:cob(I)alamin adenosyltransferase
VVAGASRRILPRVRAYGTVDDLNSAIGVALRARTVGPTGRRSSTTIQNELFDLGSDSVLAER